MAYFFCLSFNFMDVPEAQGNSQARDWIQITAGTYAAMLIF